MQNWENTKKMIYGILRKRSFEYGKFLGDKWLVIVDATQLFSFKERHCEHCLTKTVNRGLPEERMIYYYQVLEVKLVQRKLNKYHMCAVYFSESAVQKT